MILVVLLSPVYCVSADIFSAIADLEKLLETQTAIVSELPNYIEKEKSRIAYLERQLKVLEKEDKEARKDVSNYLENPLNAFRLIKRLAYDLDSEEESLDTDAGSIIRHMKLTFPHLSFASSEDLIGAAQALVRLQNTYQLNVTELAEGRLEGANSPMSSEDCFVVGLMIYEEEVEEPAAALPWLLEALRKFRDGDQPHDLTEVSLLEYIAYSYYKVGDLKSAIDWSIKIVALDPTNSEVRKNLNFYIDSIIEDSEKLHVKEDIGEAMLNAEIEPLLSPTYEPDHYEALCRGEFQPNRNITNKLFCWYSSLHHPFLVLAPIKVEQVYVEPDVFIFHQVISDSEIQHVKDLARPKFIRALVLGKDGSGPVAAQYRISKSSWLMDTESPIVARITQRIADMTGLSMASAEELQVANYGIGGQYEPHFDYAIAPEEVFIEGSNRIATVLFYMSEVAQGGATVFTELGLSVFPVKNAALYWLNLHPSGEGDLSTRHAACPVLRGSKWVSNKWIHQTGQELIRPCTLEFQPRSMVRPILKPLQKTFR